MWRWIRELRIKQQEKKDGDVSKKSSDGKIQVMRLEANDLSKEMEVEGGEKGDSTLRD